MNIQNYILPEWKKKIATHELPKNIENQFILYGESMAEYLDRFMMRSLPENWYRGWTRYKFPLSTDSLVLDLHEVIARNFGEYVVKYRSGNRDTFSIDNSEIDKIVELQNEYQTKLETKEHEFDTVRSEIHSLRKIRENRPKKKRVKKKVRRQPVPQETEPTASQTDTSEPTEKKVHGSAPDHEYVYKKWMEMVESKPISKSYWHIHEYMSRYILDFAKKHTEDGIITKAVIEDFLADYGKGKRPKTMNHYNRVVYRFWEFYETLIAPEADEMDVW